MSNHMYAADSEICCIRGAALAHNEHMILALTVELHEFWFRLVKDLAPVQGVVVAGRGGPVCWAVECW